MQKIQNNLAIACLMIFLLIFNTGLSQQIILYGDTTYMTLHNACGLNIFSLKDENRLGRKKVIAMGAAEDSSIYEFKTPSTFTYSVYSPNTFTIYYYSNSKFEKSLTFTNGKIDYKVIRSWFAPNRIVKDIAYFKNGKVKSVHFARNHLNYTIP